MTTDVSERELLERVLQHLQRLDQRVEAITELALGQAAAAGDSLDDLAQRLQRRGVDIDARMARGLELLDKLSEPATLDALQRLVSLAPQLAELAHSLPGLAATLGDTIDAFVQRATHAGVEVAAWLQRLPETLTELTRGGVFSPETVHLIGQTAQAAHHGLAASQAGERVGMFGALNMLRDPDVQRALAFLRAFAQSFGKSLIAAPRE